MRVSNITGGRAAAPAPPGGGDSPPPPAQAALIHDSHERCLALGVSRIDRPDLARLGRPDLAAVRERNRRLFERAAPVMELLHDQIVDTDSMVLLTDASGVVLHSIGDGDFLDRAAKVALAPGANWSEAAKGTNAVGTALIEERPVLVHADEHYLHANDFLTCSAAPILDPRGHILGVLDVSGDRRGYHRHTMALVKMSARMIENRWLTDDARDVLRLHCHPRPEFLGTLTEGIVAVMPDGRIVGVNRAAQELLGMSGMAMRRQTVDTLFGVSVSTLVDHAGRHSAMPLALPRPDAPAMHVVVRVDWPRWQALALPQLAAARAAPPQAPADADTVERAPASPEVAAALAPPAAASVRTDELARFCTGDVRVQRVVERVRRVLDRDIPLLILGETGTGKEHLARAVHAASIRAARPFVAVHCASIPETLIEAELFGHAEGAFTGARRPGSPGRIVEADGGTLFLDEIGDLPLQLQAQLLRVLQERHVTPLGSGGRVPVDVTILCATHRDLRRMIDAGQFRADLYYRLNGLAVTLPPLRERSDLAALVDAMLAHSAAERPPELDDEVRRLLLACAWPGNLRQLSNVLRAARAMAGPGQPITLDHLPDDFVDEARANERAASPGPADSIQPLSAPNGAATLEARALQAIRDTLLACNGNVTEASRRLGISRNTIYRKLR